LAFKGLKLQLYFIFLNVNGKVSVYYRMTLRGQFFTTM